MAINVTIQTYRGTKSDLSSLASTGKIGVLAWTTDSQELFMDQGSGTAGIGAPGSGFAWQKIANSVTVFTAASQTAMIALAAQIGDLCDRTDVHQIFILTAYPATAAGNWTAISPDATVTGLTAGQTGVTSLSGATAHEWVTYIDSSGTQHLAQPAFTDISGQLAQTQLPTSIGAGSSLTSVDCGTF